MKRLFLITLLIIVKFNASASIVYASNYGWNSDNSANAIKSAINSAADTIIIDKQIDDWVVSPLSFSDIHDKTLIFQPGVILRARTGSFPNNSDCLLRFIRSVNIKIIGYGATFYMKKTEYAALADGEWRHSLSINNSGNIEVYGLKLEGSGGDGIYISGDTWYGEQLYSENIVLKDLWCDNHYRQGISIISAQHVYVKNCWFTNTSGTLPMSGVDLEPESDSQRMADVVFEKCRFTGNYGNGIQLSFGRLSSASIPLDVKFIDCYSSGNHNISNSYEPAEINIGAAKSDPMTGTAKFIRCMVENSFWTAVYIRKPSTSFLASFDDCVFLNVSQDVSSEYNTPIWIEVSDYYNACPRFGGAEFNNCLLSYNTNLNFLGSYGEISTSPGMGDVRLNNLTVINPSSTVTYNATAGGGSPDNSCLFDFNKFTTAPATTLTLSAQNSIIECESKNSILESVRTSNNITFPLGITYQTDGMALQGKDYTRMNGFLIIPNNSLSQKDTIFVLKDETAELPKTIFINLVASQLFTSNSLPQIINVKDCTTGIGDIHPKEIFTVFPNPSYNYLELKFKEYYSGPIQVIDEKGQLVFSIKGEGDTNIINTSSLSNGVYFIKVQITDRPYIQKIIKL